MSSTVKFLFISVFLLGGCTAGKNDGSAGKLKVGLVFDIGGRGDKSFNDSAYRGLEKAKADFDIYTEYVEPGSGADRESALRMFASRGFDLVFGIGILFTDDITRIANDFPDVDFVCIDYNISEGLNVPDNLAAINYSEQEGSFLVGSIAGLMTKTGTVGFIGGMDIPLIHKFETGFVQGVKEVNPGCRVLVAYAGVTGEAFKNPAKGKELALSQYHSGADIIYHASGSTGLGVFEAAREKDMLAIGVDSDQYHEAPGNILTSMIKRVDVSVYHIIRNKMTGQFEGGIKQLGLKDNGVGYIYDENNRFLISPDIISRVEELKRKIIDGEIEIQLEEK